MTIVDQLAKNVLVLLATSVSTSAIDGAIPTKKNAWKRCYKRRKRSPFSQFKWNKDMDDIIRIIK